MYALDNWGDQDVAAWGASIANSWTTSPPVNYNRDKPTNVWQSMKYNFQNNLDSHMAAGPGHFNDPGHLLVGRQLLTDEEEKTQFALWCVSKAPLFITANVTTLSNPQKAVLTNAYLVGVNQDSLGQQAACAYNCNYDPSVSTVTSYQAQTQDAAGAYIVVVAVNWSDTTAVDLKYDLQANGISYYQWDSCSTQDLWTGAITYGDGGVQDYGSVPAHGHVAKKISCSPF